MPAIFTETLRVRYIHSTVAVRSTGEIGEDIDDLRQTSRRWFRGGLLRPEPLENDAHS
jgi:hypothetical protein